MTVLAFCHIPKTAGSSLNHLLQRYFGATMCAARHRPGASRQTYQPLDYVRDRRLYRHLRCVAGHGVAPWIDFGEHEADLRWFTFLRHPYKRYVSLYVHQQTGRHHAHKMDLVAWSRRFKRANGMVQMLAGEQNVQKAIDIVEHKMRFVGLAERYDQSLHMLARTFALDGFDPVLKRNRMVSRDDTLAQHIAAYPERYQDVIEASNSLDLELFAYVEQTVWPRQLNDPGGGEEIPARCQSRLSKMAAYAGFQLKDKFMYRPLLLAEQLGVRAPDAHD